MDELTQRLQDEQEAGAFRLNCEVPRLCEAANAAGLAWLEADLAATGCKGEFLAALAQAIRAPEWFGNNWDALADALGDLSWLDPAPGYVVLLRNGGESFGLSAEEHATALAIFAATAAFWRSQRKPFWVFFC